MVNPYLISTQTSGVFIQNDKRGAIDRFLRFKFFTNAFYKYRFTAAHFAKKSNDVARLQVFGKKTAKVTGVIFR